MLSKLFQSFLRLIFSTHITLLLISAFLGINILYFWFGGWLLIRNDNYDHLNFITFILSSAATIFAAVTAAILVLNWKHQHNLSLISKLVTEIWDLHSKFTSEIYKLTYQFSIDTKEFEYKSVYSELIQIAVPLRSKSQQLQVLLEGQIDSKSWELLQNHINYLEMFYPWSAIDFFEYRDNKAEFMEEFKYANSSILNICRRYIYIK